MNEGFMQIKDAAKFLGVTALTLRNWDKAGKLEAYRHPINNYRVYKQSDLEALIDLMKSGERPIRTKRPTKKILTVLHLKD